MKRPQTDRKVDILRNVTGYIESANRIQLSGHDADNVAARIEEWSTAIAWLNGRADLKIARVITNPDKGAHDSGRYICCRCKKTGKRITHRDYGVSWPDRAAISKVGYGPWGRFDANNCEIIPLISCHYSRWRDLRTGLCRNAGASFDHMEVRKNITPVADNHTGACR